jgi:CubicO group peptidase (beta-lactamase class C family)
MHKFRVAIVIIFLAAVQSVAGQPTTIGKTADKYLTTLEKQGRFSGSILIAKGDKVLLRKGYGQADYEQGIANKPETIFRIGSITKMFTAFSILQLEERGLLSMNDPASKHVPEIPEAWKTITIHQLLNHTSGVPDFIDAPAHAKYSDPLRVEASLKQFADKPLINPPGEKLRYSNSGYILLGRIVEKVSGKKYEQYIAENVLRPAGMTNTAYDHRKPLLKGRAHGYLFDGEYLINAPSEDMEGPHSAGALHSTIDDLYRFDRALKSGKLFRKDILTKAWTPYIHWNGPPPFNFDAEYGYGWMIGKKFNHNYVGHGGWVGGFVSDFVRFPDDDVVIILLSNIEAVSYMNVSRDLAAIVFGEKYELPPTYKIVHPSAEVLQRYEGKYAAGPLEVKVALEEDGRLSAFGTGQRFPFVMIASSDTEFFFNEIESRIKFVLDDSGKSASCVVRLQGQEYVLNRVDR